MKLVEKKCPNCGGELKFGPDDKETKCEYCGKSFEIERDEKVSDSKENLLNSEMYSLTEEQKEVAKAVVAGFASFQIVPFIIFAIFFIGIVGLGIFGFTHTKDINHNKITTISDSFEEDEEDKEFEEKVQKEVEKTFEEVLKEQSFVTSFNDLTEKHLSDIHENSLSMLKAEIKRYNTFLYSYGNWSYVGSYLLTNRSGNNFYDVYKINFKINGKNVYYYASVSYSSIKVIDGKLVMNMSGFVNGSLNTNSSAKAKDTFGYESDKDFYNKEIRGKSSSYIISTIGDVYNE